MTYPISKLFKDSLDSMTSKEKREFRREHFVMYYIVKHYAKRGKK